MTVEPNDTADLADAGEVDAPAITGCLYDPSCMAAVEGELQELLERLGTDEEGSLKDLMEQADVDEMNGANLARADLSDQDLQGISFISASFAGAVMCRADLRFCDLRFADLSGTDLQEADLRGADLSGANLRGAKLKDAHLDGASLEGATGLTPSITSRLLKGVLGAAGLYVTARTLWDAIHPHPRASGEGEASGAYLEPTEEEEQPVPLINRNMV